LEKVFDRFYRGEEAAIRPGFGLRLPIAKALTEGVGGTIAIESEQDQGSTVVLRFPAA
jgi:signal transduction histidine kinase